jgi:NAD(P)-dependent dehydrogenase (short-subunit alcohol dehydrogenase family)
MSAISADARNPLSLFELRDSVTVITGASGSLGRIVAIAVGALHGKLLLVSGSKAELDQVASEVRDVGGDVQTLVRRPDTLADAQGILQSALEHFGRVDQLVVASGFNKAGFIQDQDYATWQIVMDANVRGPWLLAKAFGSYWIKEGIKGKVVLVSSTRGRHGNVSGYTAYCTSKGATDMLTRVLATEWAKYGIRVNAIAPTVFRSKLTAWMWQDEGVGKATRERTLSRIPLGRLGEPEDLIGIALFLLSRASDFCTGQIMYVDGGFTAG